MEEFYSWFDETKLTPYKQMFLDNGYDDLEVLANEGVVSNETVVLRRWGSNIQKFGFINGVDNVNWPPYRDSKS